jgi:cyclopropane fatty-acyl-phospholipid synthase-like methyltransferase
MTVSKQERERVRQYYESQAQENPRHAAVLGEPNDFAAAYREHQELAVFREIVPLQSSTRFIEFGSGGGRWLEAVAATVRECVGVEFSNRCVEISRQRLADFDNVSIHRSDIQDFDLESEFDVLYYSGVLLYLSDEEINTSLGNHLPYLSPDGMILIRDSVSLTQTHQYRHPKGYLAIHRTIEDWLQIMERHGLELAARAPANARPLSEAKRRSKALRWLHRIARRCGLESSLMKRVGDAF